MRQCGNVSSDDQLSRESSIGRILPKWFAGRRTSDCILHQLPKGLTTSYLHTQLDPFAPTLTTEFSSGQKYNKNKKIFSSFALTSLHGESSYVYNFLLEFIYMQ